MPLTLYKYLIRSTLAPFFASLAIMTAILFLGRFIPVLNIILKLGVGFNDFIRLCAYMAPKLLIFSIPMASMLGIILCFTRLVNDNEILALKAGGVGLSKILPAVIIVGLISALLTAFCSIVLIPKSEIAMKKLYLTLAKEKIHRGMREKNFSDGLKNAVIYVDKIDPKTREWHGVYVSDTSDPKTPLTVSAQSGRLYSQIDRMLMILTLENGEIHQARENKSLMIKFREYSLSIPVDNQQTIESMDKTSMSLPELLYQAASAGPDSRQRISYLIEYHYRLVLPIAALILSILGLPLALRNIPGQRAVGLPLGILFFVSFYVSLTASIYLAEEKILPVGLSMWMPNTVFTIFTIYVLYITTKEKRSFLLESGMNIIQGISNRLPSLNRKKS